MPPEGRQARDGTKFEPFFAWPMTLVGAHLYFWGRIFYAGASMAGFPLVRSLSWNIPTSGILLFVIALLS